MRTYVFYTLESFNVDYTYFFLICSIAPPEKPYYTN